MTEKKSKKVAASSLANSGQAGVAETSSVRPRFSITNPMTVGLTAIERARGFLEAAALSDSWVGQMSQNALLREAHYSTHIEGTRLTLEESERLFAGLPVPGADPNDVRELLNYRRAFELVSGYLGKGGPVTESLIREIHKRLVEGVRGGNAVPGEYRKIQNYIVNSVTRQVVYTPPPPHDVPAMMKDLIDWINLETDAHPVLVSGIAQFLLVHVHPFIDGNGRTSRLLSTLCLYRAGYDFKQLFTLSEFYDRDRSAFYRAIQSVRENEMDMTRWLEYFIEGLATQLSEVKQRGELIIRRDVLAQQHGLTKRQKAAVGFLLEFGRMTIKDLEGLFPNVDRRTLQRDLQALIRSGLLIAEGSTNQVVYQLHIKG